MAENSIRDTLKDVLKHTHGLGIFEMAKIRGDVSETNIETMDAEKTVLVKGRMHNPVADFVDQTVGLSRMSVLDSYLKYPGYEADEATVEVVTQERNGATVPVEVKFEDQHGSRAHYRFMLADVVNQQLKDIKFKGAENDVTVIPSDKNLRDLSYFGGALAGLEDKFTPRTEDGKLYFLIGDGASDRARVLVSDHVDSDITNDMSWSLGTVLKILKLGATADVVMGFNNKGLLKIVVNSGLGEYTYLLPAQK